MENIFSKELNKIQNKYPKIIKEVRGKGLLIGLSFTKRSNKIYQ